MKNYNNQEYDEGRLNMSMLFSSSKTSCVSWKCLSPFIKHHIKNFLEFERQYLRIFHLINNLQKDELNTSTYFSIGLLTPKVN